MSDQTAGIQPFYRSFKYSLRRYYIDYYLTRQAESLQENTLLLDIGGHKNNARGQFQIERFPAHPVFLNLVHEKRPDVQADGAYLPFRDQTFEVVFCSEVLEHVPEPQKILAEAGRVLKPGGRLVLTVPFLYRFHSDPHDYGRYTHVYWQEQLAAHGFERIEITHQGMYWSVAIEMIRQWVAEQRAQGRLKAPIVRGVVTRGFGWARRRAIEFDSAPARLSSSFHSAYTTGYGISAVRQISS